MAASGAIGLVALIGAGGLAFLGLSLARVTTGRNDAQPTTARVVKGYFAGAGLLGLLGLALIL
jgi:hypothetical protein